MNTFLSQIALPLEIIETVGSFVGMLYFQSVKLAVFVYIVEDKRPMGRVLLALAEGPSGP